MKLALVCIYTFIGAVMFAVPNMTRRGILFAVPVPADFREGPIGRRSITIFRGLILAVLLPLVCALLFAPDRVLGPVSVAAPFLLMLVTGIGFFWQHHTLEPYAVHTQLPREAALSTAPDRLPWFAWLAAGPFAILTASALFLQANWERIPERFPVHWGANGQPNRWSERNVQGVYGPLLFGLELCLWFVAAGLASWFGARRSHLRSALFGCLIAVEYMLGVLFSIIAINPLVSFPVWAIALSPMLFVVPVIIVMMRAAAQPSDPPEPTPDECWKGGGVIYYNPNDPAVMVEKRFGAGYTFNFANRWSWVLLGSLILVVLSIFLIV
ncbi:MAG: DUF5808 domain-containing protein [Bryobacteraceae bacterium]